MRRTVRLAVPAAVLLAAAVSFAAQGAGAATATTLAQAAQRTISAPSLRFDLAAQVARPNSPTQTLLAQGATAPAARELHLRIGGDGSAAGGPFADEKSDGRFLYFRSSLTLQAVGPLWVRQRLSTLPAGAAPLKMLEAVVPRTLLRALAQAETAGHTPATGVLHARLPYDDPVVRRALAGVEGGLEFRGLRVTAWTDAHGYLRRLLLTGVTPDGASTLTLELSLHGYGEPVRVVPPPAGRFVDLDLARLQA